MVDELAPSAGIETGFAVSVMEATCADVPMVTFVACVTPLALHVMTAIPDVVPAISDTTTLPVAATCVATVMVLVPFENVPSVVLNVTRMLGCVTGLPDASISWAVMVEELAPSAGSEDGLADSRIEAICDVAPIPTFVACVTPLAVHVTIAIPDVVPAIKDTTTLPVAAAELCVVNVMVLVPFENVPSVVLNVTRMLDALIGLPDESSSSAVRVEELAPSAGSEVGLAVSVMEAICADVPMVTFVA